MNLSFLYLPYSFINHLIELTLYAEYPILTKLNDIQSDS